MKYPELGGCDFSANLLTASSQRKGKPGRPQKIPDEMLRCARGELLFALEQRWALIGWELQQAETPADIQAALLRIQGITCRNLELFCIEYPQETTFSQLQAVRKRFEEVSSNLRKAHSNWKKCKETAELAQSALSNTRDPQKSEELLPIRQGAEAELAQAHKTLNQLQTRWGRQETALRQRGAAFAQSELIAFIRSDRYASTPLDFANAMAGLPHIHWRQSMDRCLSFQDGASNGLIYRRFQIIANVLRHPAAYAEEAIQRMNARLVEARGQDVIPLNALAEGWYFLRCAIESVFNDEHQPKEALPYRIFAEYQRRSECQSPLDNLQAKKEVITTPAFVKERRRISTPGQGAA